MDLLSVISISIVAVGLSVILHEVVHGYVAKYLGDTTAEAEGRLTLNPAKHIDPIFTLALPVILAVLNMPIFGAAKPVPVDSRNLKGQEFGMALVAVAGPITNLVLAIAGGLVFNHVYIDSELWNNWWKIFISVNIGFFIFNMIPIPPLDGSRLLYAFAPEPVQDFMKKLEIYGLFIVLALVLVGMPVIGPVLNNIYNAIYTTIINL